MEEKDLISLAKAMVGRYIQMFALYVPMTPSMRVKCQRARGVNIGRNVFIGFEVYIDPVHPHMITIEDDVALSGKNLILVHTSPPSYLSESHPQLSRLFTKTLPVTIKRGAWISVGVTILPGVTIGENSIVTAGSIVSKDIPSNCIARGNPAEAVFRFNKKPDSKL
ncbi:acyltransferase [Methanolobus halotolerans]|uniref:acyltransferase n=1 Tax=Methanolobus halotolerans TaxID=2052935 RepID=UPI00197B69D6|nr:acyltransferase [Methanolobus halotolerans]